MWSDCFTVQVTAPPLKKKRLWQFRMKQKGECKFAYQDYFPSDMMFIFSETKIIALRVIRVKVCVLKYCHSWSSQQKKKRSPVMKVLQCGPRRSLFSCCMVELPKVESCWSLRQCVHLSNCLGQLKTHPEVPWGLENVSFSPTLCEWHQNCVWQASETNFGDVVGSWVRQTFIFINNKIG